MAEGTVVGPWPPALSVAGQWTADVMEPEPTAPGRPQAIEDADDRALVALCLEGDQRAFDLIVERHRRAVYQVCYRFAPRHEDASDLSQEVFVRAWRGLKGYRGQAAFSTWLYRIAVNVCLNRVSVRTVETEPLAADRFVDELAEEPSAGLIRGERAAVVRRAIAALPPKQRATLILRTYQELSHKEIAEVLGSSVGAVKANFFHALANLKKTLGGEP